MKINDIIPLSNDNNSTDGDKNKLLYFVTFEEYLNILKKYSPDGLKRTCQTSGIKNIDDVIKLNRALLRKIFIKFTLLQEKVKENNSNENKLNLEIFLLFIQNGMVLNLINSDENSTSIKK